MRIGRMRIPKKDELLKLKARYKTSKMIAQAIGVPEYLVSYWIRKRSRQKPSNDYRASKFSIDRIRVKTIKKRKVQNAYSLNEIEILAQHYPTSEREKLLQLLPRRSWGSIKMKASNLGIKKQRVGTEALRLFQTWSEESAWIFGVLFPKAVITLHPWPRLVFWSTRKPLVERVASALGVSGRIGANRTRTKTLYFTTIARRELIDRFQELGLVRLKKRRRFPDIPQACICHFLRGFFDCESSIIPSNRRWGVGFARKDVVEKIRDIFYEEAGIENLRTGCAYKIFYSPKGHHWYFRIGGINLVRLHEYLYNDVDNIMYNEDKKDQFDKLLEIWQKKTVHPML